MRRGRCTTHYRFFSNTCQVSSVWARPLAYAYVDYSGQQHHRICMYISENRGNSDTQQNYIDRLVSKHTPNMHVHVYSIWSESGWVVCGLTAFLSKMYMYTYTCTYHLLHVHMYAYGTVHIQVYICICMYMYQSTTKCAIMNMYNYT